MIDRCINTNVDPNSTSERIIRSNPVGSNSWEDSWEEDYSLTLQTFRNHSNIFRWSGAVVVFMKIFLDWFGLRMK